MTTLRFNDKKIHTELKLACIKKGIPLYKGIERILRIAVEFDLINITDEELEFIRLTRANKETAVNLMQGIRRQ